MDKCERKLFISLGLATLSLILLVLVMMLITLHIIPNSQIYFPFVMLPGFIGVIITFITLIKYIKNN